MGTIYIDGRPVEFSPGDNVLQAALRAGIDTPYFCYHEALGPAGACRVCAMELEPVTDNDKPRVVMSCMQPAQDGQRYRLNDGRADRVRKHVVEYYMTRHTHDCPVCDEAGDCHLQDMTILSHQTYRRYDGKKRTFADQDMGPLIWNVANRCITCYRCVRFYQDYALGDDLGAYGSGQRTTFRRASPGPFLSPFSGNLSDVCPTGTFTDKVYRRKYSRTWQLEKGPSVCGHCPIGCNTEPGGRNGTLRRIHPRANPSVNPFFICDRGRYGEHYSEETGRPLSPMVNGIRDTRESALAMVADRLEESRGRVGVLSSVNEDLATHFAMAHLARHFDGMFSPFVLPQAEERVRAALHASLMPAALTQMEKASGAFIVGSLTEAAPMADLAMRRLIAAGKPVYMLHAAPSLLADLIRHRSAGHITRAAPAQWAEIITAMNAPVQMTETGPNLFAHLDPGAEVVITAVAAEMEPASIEALYYLARALESKNLQVRLSFIPEGANATGAALISPAGSARAMLDAVRAGSVDTLVICGADPAGYGSALWSELLNHITHLTVLDNVSTDTVRRANIFLPLATWSERDGYTVNYEGRVQAFTRAYQRKEALCPAELTALLTGCDVREIQCDITARTKELAGKPVRAGTAGVCVNIKSAFPYPRATSAGSASSVSSAFTAGVQKVTGEDESRGDGASGNSDGRDNDEGTRRESARKGVQLVRLPWHGGGDKADYATALASVKPWNDGQVYMHPQTAQQLDFKNGRLLSLPSGVTLYVMVTDRVAPGVMAMTRSTLNRSGYPVNKILSYETLRGAKT